MSCRTTSSSKTIRRRAAILALLGALAPVCCAADGGGVSPWHVIVPLAAGVALGFTIWSLRKNGKRGWGWVVAGTVAMLVLALFTAIGRLSRRRRRTGWLGSSLDAFGGRTSGGGGARGGW